MSYEYMTQEQAKLLAQNDKHYRAKKCRDGTWCVWDDVSDHIVTFDKLPKEDK